MISRSASPALSMRSSPRPGVPVSAIGLVSLSTTLATNALVEGQGGRAGLVMIGFGPDDLKRDGLPEALGSDPVIFLPGGHNVHGNENPLDLDGSGRGAAGAFEECFVLRDRRLFRRAQSGS